MNIHLEALLPEDVSDATAFHIANFMMDLALAVDSHYFGVFSKLEGKLAFWTANCCGPIN